MYSLFSSYEKSKYRPYDLNFLLILRKTRKQGTDLLLLQTQTAYTMFISSVYGTVKSLFSFFLTEFVVVKYL